MDFKDMKGQEYVKRGLEVAVAGQHNVILIGPKDAPIMDLIKRIATITPLAAAKIKAYSMKPCPCGNFTHPKRECRCSPIEIQRYIARVPKDVTDKADIHLEVPALNVEHLSEKRCGETSEDIRNRIASVSPAKMNKACRNIDHIEIDKEGNELLKLAILELGISACAYDKIIRVAYTIARLDHKNIVEAHHISEAISYRSLDRNLWG